MTKVGSANVASQIIEWAIHAHSGAGDTDKCVLAGDYAGIRTLRLADGPDEVHRVTIARLDPARDAVKA